MRTKITCLFLFLFTCTLLYAQDISGLWVIKKVLVGGQTMTPVAKWTNIQKDGSYQSGNGWLQNAEGTWTFDKKKKLYAATETNGIKDEFGPFTVELKNNTMTWLREEEGMIVTVLLEKTDQMPKSTADRIVGLWDLFDITKDGKSTIAIQDPNNKRFIHIRWDRLYRERTAQGKRSTGYWHMHGHKPEVTLLSHNGKKVPETWKVSVSSDELKMLGVSDSNRTIEITYRRIHQFPK